MQVKVRSYRPAFANEQRCFRIGCQFVKQLKSNAFRWNAETEAIEHCDSISYAKSAILT